MLLLDISRLSSARQAAERSDKHLLSAIQALKDSANEVKSRPFRTVMDKELSPPSGDKHDYFSFGPYWWPNPETPDGLPFIRRDGLLNPTTSNSDKPALHGLTQDVEALTLAYFYSGDETLAQAAAARLRAWFIDSETRMNPHLEYGQAVPGLCDGRGIGIIDTGVLRLLPDMLELLSTSSAWTAEDDETVREWMGNYLDWLLTSGHGKDEASEHNNHGTWYDVQVAFLSLATGREDVARNIFQNAPEKRFAPQVAPDGSQPHELARTRSFSYSCYNLTALFDMATLASRVGVDLWHWQGENGASLRLALEYLAPYADPKNSWPHEQVVVDDGSQLLQLLRRAAIAFPDGEWMDAIEKAEQTSARANQLRLMWPV